MWQRPNTREVLNGLRVLLTRPQDSSDALTRQLVALGADVIHHPVIRISEPADWAPVDAALNRLEQYDWLVFSSANGVRYLFDRLRQRADRSMALKIAAIGPGTADALGHYGRHADLVPAEYRAEALAAALLAQAPRARFLLARASRGREVLSEQLCAAGASVEQVVVYTSSDVDIPDPDVARDLADQRIDWTTVTSSAIARSLVRLFGASLARTRLASISPLTSAALRELGHTPAAEATQYTMEGLVDAIVSVQTG